MQTPYRQLQRLATFKERGHKIKLSLHVKVSALIMLLLVIPFTAFFLSPITSASVNFIEALQRIQIFSTLRSAFEITSQSCSPWMLAQWSAVLYHMLDPRPGVKVITVSCFGLYTCSLLNMLYGEPRPYWESSNLKGYLCKQGFGLPSMELFLSVVFYFYLAIQLLRKGGGYYLGIAVYTVLILGLGFQAVGEVVLGEHFPHQVFITACYAFIYITLMLSQDTLLTRWCYRAAFNYEKNRKYSVYLVLITISLLVLAVIVAQMASRDYLPSLWLTNATKQCESSIGVVGAFTSTSLLLYGAGVLTGSMHTSKHLHEFWWNTPLWKGCVRALLAVGAQSAVFFIASQLAETDQVTDYVFGQAVPMMVAGYGLSGVLPTLFELLNLTEADRSQECVI
jgi:hypothetical protein